jgi:endonuclease/exonuclease/phosphatase (EEP) superfamily protein YafD
LGLVLLYLPRASLALPLLVTVPLILISGSFHLIVTQFLCLWLILFPLMGLKPPSRPQAIGQEPSIRVLSYNVWFANRGVDAIRAEVERAQAQIVLFQAVSTRAYAVLEGEPFAHWHTLRFGRLAIASRFPIAEHQLFEDASGMPFARFTLETPLGTIDLYSVHTISPRGALNHFRMFRQWVPSESARFDASLNTQLREQQIRHLVEVAHKSKHPVLIAGDINLPVLSRLEREHFRDFRDAFNEVGSGFGYTFPTNAPIGPWMRIDRIFAGPGLRFLRFFVGGGEGSDHCPVIADVAAGSVAR